MSPACVALLQALGDAAQEASDTAVLAKQPVLADRWQAVAHAAAAVLAEAEGETEEDEGHSRIVSAELVDAPAPADPAPGDELDRLITEFGCAFEDVGREGAGWTPGDSQREYQRRRDTRAAIHAEVQRRVAAARGDGLRLTDAISSMVALVGEDRTR